MDDQAEMCPCVRNGDLAPGWSGPSRKDPDHPDATVTLRRCGRCGRPWLSYFFEYTYFPEERDRTAWYRGLLSESQVESVTPGSARAVLEGLEWYWAGGSHHLGHVHRSSGPLQDPG